MMGHIIIFAAFSLILSSSPSILSHAQTFKPNYAINPATTFIERQVLYVIGGLDPSNNTNPLNQVFYLDLSSEWKTDNPPFKSLPAIERDYYTAAGIFDFDTLILTTKKSIKTYGLSNSNLSTIGNVTWVQQPGGVIGVNSAKDTFFVTNVTTSGDVSHSYVAYNSKDGSLDLPTSNSKFFSIWYESTRQLFINHITDSKTVSDSEITSSGVKIINVVSPGGSLLQLKQPSCAVGSTKYTVVFGNIEGSESSSIATYDFKKFEWKEGSKADFSLNPAACAVSGDYFVVWGGLSNGETSVKVYNLNGSFWTDKYGAFDPASNHSPKNIAGVAGGASAAVILLIALFI